MKRIRSNPTILPMFVFAVLGAFTVACGNYSDDDTEPQGTDDSDEVLDCSAVVSDPAPVLPCDLLGANSPCVAAHSTVRVLRTGYTGPLYQLCRGSATPGPNSCQGETMDIYPAAVGSTGCEGVCPTTVAGYADICAHNAFCEGFQCTISKVYDQAAHASGPPNDLEPAPPGGAKNSPGKPVYASDLPVTVNGHQAYGMLFMPGMGYRAGCDGCNTPIGTDMAVEDEPQTIYMITSVHDANNGCCFDYGNAETTCNNDHNGTMEAVYFGFGVIWGTGSGDGPWVMADLEDGLYPGWDDVNKTFKGIATAQPLQHDFVNAVIVGDTAEKNGGKGRFAVYGSDAQNGPLIEMYDGIRPDAPGYVPMQKQGSLILGIGGDNSDGDAGRFYEAAIVNTPLDKVTLDNFQVSIVAAKYGN